MEQEKLLDSEKYWALIEIFKVTHKFRNNSGQVTKQKIEESCKYAN